MRVCVVGGGPAGMMAAISAAESKNTVTLIEQNDKLGKKLFLTGKGRCNLTNACPTEELFDNVVTNPKFLYSAFYDLDNAGTVEMFGRLGLATKVERGDRVFPKSDHSSSVIDVLKRELDRAGVDVRLRTRVTRIECSDDSISGVIINEKGSERSLECDAVIMATGGRSYPLTGSDGSSFRMLEDLGIKLVDCFPALVPFECDDCDITSMQGLALKNVEITVRSGKKTVYSGFGEMLFTHFGLSGPLILSASSYTQPSDYKKGITVSIDLKPALSAEELDKRILRDFAKGQNRDFANSLGELLPNKLISCVIKRTGIDRHKKVNLITKQERHRLCEILKGFEIKVTGNRGFDEAIITRGGVSTSSINPSTMESKSIKGLYFAGEMIDTDALTGGFNLQIAWSTGYLAGKCK
ncbi:MAG: NAD(P)/FAD-dependent oxidoreductase [Lachnospiraceae bacterium]|nr:NAD(P)/FAD-dependent oxidoreductase [Lachnospiraceae bacterium]